MKKLLISTFLLLAVFQASTVKAEDFFDLKESVGLDVQPLDYLVSPDKNFIVYEARMNDEIGYSSQGVFVFDVENRTNTKIEGEFKSFGSSGPIKAVSNSYVAITEIEYKSWVKIFLINRILLKMGVEPYITNVKIFDLENQTEVTSFKKSDLLSIVDFSPNSEKLLYQKNANSSEEVYEIGIYTIDSGSIKTFKNSECDLLGWFSNEDLLCKQGKFNINNNKLEDIGIGGLDNIISAEWIVANKSLLIRMRSGPFTIVDVENKKAIPLDINNEYGVDYVVSDTGYVEFVFNSGVIDENENVLTTIKIYDSKGMLVKSQNITEIRSTGFKPGGVAAGGNYFYSRNYCARDMAYEMVEYIERVSSLMYKDIIDQSTTTIFELRKSEKSCPGNLIFRSYYDETRNVYIDLGKNKISFYPIN